MHAAKSREIKKKNEGGLFGGTGEKIRRDHSQTMDFIDDKLNMSNQIGTNQKSNSNHMVNNFDGNFEIDNNVGGDPADYPYSYGGDLIPEADRMANEGNFDALGNFVGDFDLGRNYFLSGPGSENKIVNQNAAAKVANDNFEEFCKIDRANSPVRFDKRAFQGEGHEKKEKAGKRKLEETEKRVKIVVDKDMTGLDMTLMNNTTINPFDNR